ncbi:predicted protein [Nematostella vectensis]|uniref:Uncharacterized protein n=1 Tax=Nematostella vectensis TaxID=45351 RepID=A7RYP4_NEMVE|nr:predicted protein [Nematostella vectensis]|eukprot:XP_001635416.1 predicted protein [Nematostella vectensis]
MSSVSGNSHKKSNDTPDDCQKDNTDEKTNGLLKHSVVDLEKLSEAEKEIYFAHKTACEEGNAMYTDPVTGYAVFTEDYHRQRGSCCGNACRHVGTCLVIIPDNGNGYDSMTDNNTTGVGEKCLTSFNKNSQNTPKI